VIDDILAMSTSLETGAGGRLTGRSTFLDEEGGFRRPSTPVAVTSDVYGDDGSDDSPRTREQKEALRTRGEWNPSSSIAAHFPTAVDASAFHPSSLAGYGEPIVFDPFRGEVHPGDDEHDFDCPKRPSKIRAAAEGGFARSLDLKEVECVELNPFVTAVDVLPLTLLPPAASFWALTPGHAARLGRGGVRSPRPLAPSKFDTGSLLPATQGNSSDGRRWSSASEASSLSVTRSDHSRLSGIFGAGRLRRLSPAPENEAGAAASAAAREAAKDPGGSNSPAANRRGRVLGAWRFPSGLSSSSRDKGALFVEAAPAARRASQHRLSGLTQNEEDDDDDLSYSDRRFQVGRVRGLDPIVDTSETGGTRLTSMPSAYEDIGRDRGDTAAGASKDRGEDDSIDDNHRRYRDEEQNEQILCREVLNSRPRQIAFVSAWAAILIGIILLSALVAKDGGGATSANLGNATTAAAGSWSAGVHSGTDNKTGTVDFGSWEDAADKDERNKDEATPSATESADAMSDVAVGQTARPFEIEGESVENGRNEAPRRENIFASGGSHRGLRPRR